MIFFLVSSLPNPPHKVNWQNENYLLQFSNFIFLIGKYSMVPEVNVLLLEKIIWMNGLGCTVN